MSNDGTRPDERTVEAFRQAMQDAMNTHGPVSGTPQALHMLQALSSKFHITERQQ